MPLADLLLFRIGLTRHSRKNTREYTIIARGLESDNLNDTPDANARCDESTAVRSFSSKSARALAFPLDSYTKRTILSKY